ncbi:nucleotidyltransferase domain-containing protein [Candidatus Pacearchaeota archaeon]|nr:nucleotidyltransferase domain-containing protein [Candidatus Pacearchaeota archaeon]
MTTLTQKERETVLILFKDYTAFYNANSISRVLNISHVGAQKIFKRLLQGNIVISKTIGKSIIYKLNFNDSYVSQLVTFLLADEANKVKRWKEEFKELFKTNRIVMLFGSIIKEYAHAHDIDLMIVIENKELKEVNDILKKKEDILPKKLHAIKLDHHDLLKNLKKRDKAFVDIIKNAIILYGQDKYVEILKNVTSF